MLKPSKLYVEHDPRAFYWQLVQGQRGAVVDEIDSSDQYLRRIFPRRGYPERTPRPKKMIELYLALDRAGWEGDLRDLLAYFYAEAVNDRRATRRIGYCLEARGTRESDDGRG